MPDISEHAAYLDNIEPNRFHFSPQWPEPLRALLKLALLLSEQPGVVLVVMVLEMVPVWSTAGLQFVSGQGAFKEL